MSMCKDCEHKFELGLLWLCKKESKLFDVEDTREVCKVINTYKGFYVARTNPISCRYYKRKWWKFWIKGGTAR